VYIKNESSPMRKPYPLALLKYRRRFTGCSSDDEQKDLPKFMRKARSELRDIRCSNHDRLLYSLITTMETLLFINSKYRSLLQ